MITFWDIGSCSVTWVVTHDSNHLVWCKCLMERFPKYNIFAGKKILYKIVVHNTKHNCQNGTVQD